MQNPSWAVSRIFYMPVFAQNLYLQYVEKDEIKIVCFIAIQQILFRHADFCPCTVPVDLLRGFTGFGMSASSVLIEWNMPPQHLHVVMLYEVTYSEDYVSLQDINHINSTKTINTTKTSVVINGIEPTSSYIFHIHISHSLQEQTGTMERRSRNCGSLTSYRNPQRTLTKHACVSRTINTRSNQVKSRPQSTNFHGSLSAPRFKFMN